MPEIDEWVLRTAGAQFKAWMDEGAAPCCVTVNLSKRQFESRDLAAPDRGDPGRNRPAAGMPGPGDHGSDGHGAMSTGRSGGCGS